MDAPQSNGDRCRALMQALPDIVYEMAVPVSAARLTEVLLNLFPGAASSE